MQLIRPVDITDAVLTSHSVPETDYPQWQAATSYAVGQRVIRTTTHRVYECLIAGANAVEPESAPTRWLDVSPTNRWAAFDQSVGSATEATGPVTIVLTPGVRVNALALLDMAAGKVTVTMTVGGAVVYTRTGASQPVLPIIDYYTYWQAQFETRDTLVLTDLPSIYSTATITIVLTGASVRLGTLVVGNIFEVGDTQYGLTAGITDYSKKETDAWGVTSVVQRSYSKRIEASVMCDNPRIDLIASAFAKLRATPVVWITAPGYTTALVYGFVKDWRLAIQYPNYSLCNLTIEGLS